MNMTLLFRKIVNGTRHFFMRLALRNHDFSIICPTCIGGKIYHQLKMQFKSPTINLWLTEDDFYEFCKNLKWYISHDLQYYGSDETADFPIGYITGPDNELIKINFNHSKDFDTALKDWNRRKSRINWDKLYVIASTRDGESRDKIERWGNISSQVSGLVCFTAHDYPDIPYALPLKLYKNCDRCGTYMEDESPILKLLPWETDFNYVRWLNNGRVK